MRGGFFFAWGEGGGRLPELRMHSPLNGGVQGRAPRSRATEVGLAVDPNRQPGPPSVEFVLPAMPLSLLHHEPASANVGFLLFHRFVQRAEQLQDPALLVGTGHAFS
jgi:hypothetical protein